MAEKSPHHLAPKYRPDIDGLRAIAVLLVLGYHAAPGNVAAGFIGVDIFFIISGYLISSIIFSNLEHGTFSIGDFYNRRIRRIFPALVTILVATLAFGWFALVADEYAYLGKHIASGAAFISNGVLYSESGYFDTAAEAKPMLHLWSLAIEEQFYLLWPLTLAFVWKRKWSFLRITAAIAILSFAANLYLTAVNPSAAFYWPISRFWQLMIGGGLAYMTLHRPEMLRHYNNARSVIGFSLLVIALLLINRNRPFPGWWALLPSFGAFFIISAGSQAWLNKHVLSNKLFIWIGLISYPLYLWHWPLLSFARIFEGTEVSRGIRLALLVLTFVLSWITYRVVEIPFRFNRYTRKPIPVLALSMAGVGLVGFSCYLNRGFGSRSTQPRIVNAGEIGHQEFLREYAKYPPCSIDPTGLTGAELADLHECHQSVMQRNIEVAVLGDSHAPPLFIALAGSLTGVNVGVFSRDALPFPDNREFENIYKYVLRDQNIRTVILAAHWSGRMDSTDTQETLEQQLSEVAELLNTHDKRIYIANDNPDFNFAPSRCKYEGRLGLANICTQDVKVLLSQLAKYQPIFQSVASKNPRVKVLDTADCFCSGNYCSMANGGLLLFRDYQHLNMNGAKFLGSYLQRHYPGLGAHPVIGAQTPRSQDAAVFSR
jgi:peptidoglycan/LPS O-acetylase OafA/YrhL